MILPQNQTLDTELVEQKKLVVVFVEHLDVRTFQNLRTFGKTAKAVRRTGV